MGKEGVAHRLVPHLDSSARGRLRGGHLTALLDPPDEAADLDVEPPALELEAQTDLSPPGAGRADRGGDCVLARLRHGDDQVVDGFDIEARNAGKAGCGSLGDHDVTRVRGQTDLGGGARAHDTGLIPGPGPDETRRSPRWSTRSGDPLSPRPGAGSRSRRDGYRLAGGRNPFVDGTVELGGKELRQLDMGRDRLRRRPAPGQQP